MKRFPDCTIYDMPQRGEAWHNIRRGKLTASGAGAWLAEEPAVRLLNSQIIEKLEEQGIAVPKKAKRDELISLLPDPKPYVSLTKGSLDARDKAINRCLGAYAKFQAPDPLEVDPDGPPPKSPGLWAIWNGLRLEEEAMDEFQRATGLETESVGFCLHRTGIAGCSPDALIVGENMGLEGKSPLPETHIGYLRAGVLPETYVEQVHFSMASTGADAWWFQSYCPGLPPFRLMVERDDYTDRMAAGIQKFAALLAMEKEAMAGLWNAELGKEAA